MDIAKQLATSKAEDQRTIAMLAAIRAIRSRLTLATAEIDSVGVSLRGGFIDCDGAINWLHNELPPLLDFMGAE